MRRVWLTVLGLGACAFGGMAMPVGALAGTFSWSLPANFTTTGNGANPDHDNYGATPWSYQESAASGLGGPSHDPSGFAKLTQFGSGIDGGLAGWSDPTDPNSLVAANPTGSPISSGQYTFPVGQLVMTPPSDRLVAIGWTSPLPTAVTVTVTGSVTPDAPSGCLFSGYSWSLDQNGTALQSSASGSSVSATTTVPSGGSIYLTVSPSSIYDAACATAGVSLTIQANAPGPQIALDSPGQSPLQTSTPTLSGVAGTASGDAGSVLLIVYDSTSGRPVRFLAGSVGSQGQFSVQLTPALADGQYTAVAAQSGPGSAVGFSNPVVFRTKVHPPALTLTSPAAGSDTSSLSPVFAGAAGSTLDDNGTVTVTVYAGGRARGKALGRLTVTTSGAAWTGRWPQSLGLGLYTAVASQSDDVGHTARTPGDTFLIVAAPSVIGANLSVSRTGLVGVPVICAAAPGQTCAGNVLVTTVRSFRPVADGPSGHLSVMFTYVTIPGATTTVVHRTMQAVVRRVLRRARLTRVTVTSLLSAAGAGAQTSTATRLIRVR